MSHSALAESFPDRLIRSLETTSDLDEPARLALRRLPLRVMKVTEGADLVCRGDRPRESLLLLDGLLCRYKLVASGSRQILSLHLPGDIPDLHGLHLRSMDHSLGAMVPSTVAYIPHSALMSVARAHDKVMDAFFTATLVDGSIFREWMTSLGQRPAIQRVSHLFCELYVRMRVLGLADQTGFRLPLTQGAMGDALGLSSVHVNRTMQHMRAEGLIESKGRFHGIKHWHALKRAGDFDLDYLHLKVAPAL